MSKKNNDNIIGPYRSPNFALLLYPDDITHKNALDIIKGSYDYTYILHDRDIDENGEIKKPHWHVILRFSNARWNTALVKELGITDNYIRPVKNFKNALLYLIHYNDLDKFQYEVEEVKGTFKNRLYELVNATEKSEGEKVQELIYFINSQEKYLTVTEFSLYCSANGYWPEFRRCSSIFIRIIEEHNYRFSNKENKKD